MGDDLRINFGWIFGMGIQHYYLFCTFVHISLNKNIWVTVLECAGCKWSLKSLSHEDLLWLVSEIVVLFMQRIQLMEVCRGHQDCLEWGCNKDKIFSVESFYRSWTHHRVALLLERRCGPWMPLLKWVSLHGRQPGRKLSC